MSIERKTMRASQTRAAGDEIMPVIESRKYASDRRKGGVYKKQKRLVVGKSGNGW